MPRIKRRRNSQLQAKTLRAKYERHVASFIVADAMFARQRATHFDHSTHQAFTDRFNSFQFSGLARVKQKIRMQIAITSMEHINRRNPDGIGFVVNQLQ